jgi:hypothetical protein
MNNLQNLQAGDKVTRYIAGIPMELKVTEITEDLIICGPYEFCRKTGAEIDEDLGWGEEDKDGKIMTGSYIKVNSEG